MFFPQKGERDKSSGEGDLVWNTTFWNKQEGILVSIFVNDFGCDFFFFFKLSARYVLEIISKSLLFAPAEFLTSWAGHCIQWNGKKAWVGVLVILYFKLDTDHTECTINSNGADLFSSINILER